MTIIRVGGMSDILVQCLINVTVGDLRKRFGWFGSSTPEGLG